MKKNLRVLDFKRISKHATHCAFTDLIENPFDKSCKTLMCCYRQATDHVSTDGAVIVLTLDKTSFQVFNAGGDDNNATKKMIVDMIASKIPKNKIVYKEQGSDPRNYRVNFSKVGTKLGFYPKFSIENGIDELLEALNKEFFTNVDSSRDYYGNYNINLEKFLNE